MELFTRFEIMIMVSVVGFLVFVILLLSLIELISKRKEKKKLASLEIETDTEEVEVNSLEEKEEDNLGELVIQQTENLEDPKEELSQSIDIKEDKNDSIIEFSPNIKEVDKEKIKVEGLEENTIKVSEPEILIEDLDAPIMPTVENFEEDSSVKANLELLKVEEELKNPMSLEDTISSLEAIEEESAIISYQELLDVTKEMQILPQEDMGDEPISITEVYEKFTGESIEHPSVDDIYQASLTNNIETENLNEIQLENTANLEKLDKEIRKTNKVLNMLNELKKNLD